MTPNSWILPGISLIVACFASADVLRERLPDSFWSALAADAQARLAQAIAQRSLGPFWRKPG